MSAVVAGKKTQALYSICLEVFCLSAQIQMGRPCTINHLQKSCKDLSEKSI